MQRNRNLGFHVQRKRFVRQLERKHVSRDWKALVAYLTSQYAVFSLRDVIRSRMRGVVGETRRAQVKLVKRSIVSR